MTSFRSLPLELRNIIYDYALEDDHDIFADGLPALLKVCPEITREIYSYRSIITTVIITNETPEPYEESAKPMLSRYLDTITKFKQMENRKRLAIEFKPQARPVASMSDTSNWADRMDRLGATMNDRFTSIKASFYSMRLHTWSMTKQLEANLIENGSETVSKSQSAITLRLASNLADGRIEWCRI